MHIIQMARIPKKLQKLPEHQQKGNSKENRKDGVKSTKQPHDPRFRDEWGIGEVGLNKKTRKQMSRTKKLTTKSVFERKNDSKKSLGPN